MIANYCLQTSSQLKKHIIVHVFKSFINSVPMQPIIGAMRCLNLLESLLEFIDKLASFQSVISMQVVSKTS